MTQKIVINNCIGGFSISKEAAKIMAQRGNKEAKTILEAREWNGHLCDTKRDDPDLVYAVEKLGNKADGEFARLKVVKIPDDVEYVIDECDGVEIIHEKHRVWG